MIPQGPGAPAPAQPQAAPQAGPPGGAPKAPQSSAGAVVGQIHDGLMKLMQMMEQAGPAIAPQDKQKLGVITTNFQSLVQDLSKGPGHAPPAQAPGPRGPMAANAGPSSQPLPQG